MTQAARSDLVSRAFPARPEITVATGLETPVASPALELQKALDEMLATAPPQPLDYGRLTLFGTVMLGAGAVCLAFWWTALSWTASVLG